MFLYFMIVLMGVSTAGVTVAILAYVVTVVTATTTDAVKCIFNKTIDCLNCGENPNPSATTDTAANSEQHSPERSSTPG